jgi:phosphoribulokinase
MNTQIETTATANAKGNNIAKTNFTDLLSETETMIANLTKALNHKKVRYERQMLSFTQEIIEHADELHISHHSYRANDFSRIQSTLDDYNEIKTELAVYTAFLEKLQNVSN